MKLVPSLLALFLATAATTAAHHAASANPGDASRGAPSQKAADGLPVVIPAPSSSPPTTAEWDAMSWEVTVKNSSRYHCETKMVREWLRVRCFPYDGWTLRGVNTVQSHGYQAYTGIFGDRASVVVQVVKGKMYVARFTWGPDNSTRDLTVNWSQGERPMFYFN